MPLYTDAELEELLSEDDPAIRQNDEVNEQKELTSFLIDYGLTDAPPKIDNLISKKTYVGPNFNRYSHVRPSRGRNWNNFHPKNLYFYYFKFDKNSSLICKVFLADLSKTYGGPQQHKAAIKSKLLDWLQLIKSGKTITSKHGLISENPEEIQWRQQGHLTFMLDEDSWDFHYKTIHVNAQAIKVNDSLHFHEHVRKKLDAHNNIKNVKYRSNKHHNFCNSFEIKISKAQIQQQHQEVKKDYTILCVENRHLNAKTGDPRELNGNEPEDHYKFDLFFRVSTSPKTYSYPENQTPETEKKLTLIIDPTGTNFGPP